MTFHDYYMLCIFISAHLRRNVLQQILGLPVSLSQESHRTPEIRKIWDTFRNGFQHQLFLCKIGIWRQTLEYFQQVPSRELTCPALGKGKSSSKVPLGGDMLVPRRVYQIYSSFFKVQISSSHSKYQLSSPANILTSTPADVLR